MRLAAGTSRVAKPPGAQGTSSSTHLGRLGPLGARCARVTPPLGVRARAFKRNHQTMGSTLILIAVRSRCAMVVSEISLVVSGGGPKRPNAASEASQSEVSPHTLGPVGGAAALGSDDHHRDGPGEPPAMIPLSLLLLLCPSWSRPRCPRFDLVRRDAMVSSGAEP